MKLYIFLQYVLIPVLLITTFAKSRKLKNLIYDCGRLGCGPDRTCVEGGKCLLNSGEKCSRNDDCVTNICTNVAFSAKGNSRECRRSFTK